MTDTQTLLVYAAIIAGLLLCIWLAHTELPVRLGQ